MRASRQWAPVFLRTAGGTGVRGDAEQSPSIEDSRRRPRARSQRPRCSTGGSGTTCGTKDTRPSRATQPVRPPSVSPSVGLHMRSIVPSARAALGVLGHARSDVHELYQLPKSARPLHLHPCYNGAPVQDFAVCRLDADGSRALATLRWGLVPSWAKDLRRGARLVNARAETVHDTPSFSTAFRARRCLVPANGWFEWQRTGHAKQPYFLARADGSPLSFAARWECWNRGQASLASFTIITTAASPGLADIHHRQPVIVDPDRLTDWLDPSSPRRCSTASRCPFGSRPRSPAFPGTRTKQRPVGHPSSATSSYRRNPRQRRQPLRHRATDREEATPWCHAMRTVVQVVDPIM